MFQELTGLQYLKAEIACKHDKAFEKATWDERIEQFNTLDLNDEATFSKASDSIGLRAAVQALHDTEDGEASGYMISLDACSSGLQLLSLLVSCPTSWNLCGGVSTKCVDSYVEIYDSMNLHGALTRKEVKAAIMTSLYGSVAMPEATFGGNVDMFYETMEKMAPGAWDLNLSLQDLWDEIPGSSYGWVMPDGFHAFIETSKKELVPFNFLGEEHALTVKTDERPEFHKGLGPNLIHSIDGMVVREMFRRCMFSKTIVSNVIDMLNDKGTTGRSAHIVKEFWDRYQETGFLTVRILDYLNEGTMGLVDPLVIAKLIQTLPETPFELVSVHDCFRCHPNYGNDLRKQYNNVLADINDSTMLKSMAAQVTGRNLNTKKVGKIDRDTILQGNYLLA